MNTLSQAVVEGYKEEQTTAAVTNSTLQKTEVGKKLLLFPSKLTEHFCK